MTAADIGYLCSNPEFFNNPVQSWKPRRNEIGVIAGSEKSLCSMKETRVVLAPFHALSCPEILERTVQGVKSGFDNVVRARHVDRPIGVREAKGLFWAQRPFIFLGVKLHISAGALVTE